MKLVAMIAVFLAAVTAHGANGWLVKFKDQRSLSNFNAEMGRSGVAVNNLNFANWVKVDMAQDDVEFLKQDPNVLYVEKNRDWKIQTNIEVHDPMLRQKVYEAMKQEQAWDHFGTRGADNPEIPLTIVGGSGADPLFGSQWGMMDNNVKAAWEMAGTKGSENVIVAVIDTGVDYTHEDLRDNMWRNPGEVGMDEFGRMKATNGIDDDGNGFVDDVVGWDFAYNDNKPYDLHMTGFELLTGGNPGHGTHCAGNVAATGDNGKGIAGVAPNVKIMAMRFLTEKGSGTTEGGIQSIKYAVDNGAQILSNSWGSVGEGEAAESMALQEAIQYAMDKGVLFIAAAGNGHNGVGYNNDTDPRPAFPASYPHENIISVSALDSGDALGSFSNWGPTTVDIGAPGVKVFSTVPDNVYQDTVLNFPPLIVATWDGTSMATPHVAGAAALYLSKNPGADWREIKDALMTSVTPTGSLGGKVVSGGKLNVRKLME